MRARTNEWPLSTLSGRSDFGALRTEGPEHNLAVMLRPTVWMAFAAPLLIVGSASATLPPPAPNAWARIAWQCPGRERSFIEIEQLAQGSSGYQTIVTRLVIAGRKIDPAKVTGLLEMTARRNYLRLVGGYCDSGGELVGIEELANGPKKAEAGWRAFEIPYPPSR